MKFRIGQYVTFCDGTIAKITNIKEKNIYVSVNGKIADKIRSMTDEELAKFITEDRWDCNDCPSG